MCLLHRSSSLPLRQPSATPRAPRPQRDPEQHPPSCVRPETSDVVPLLFFFFFLLLLRPRCLPPPFLRLLCRNRVRVSMRIRTRHSRLFFSCLKRHPRPAPRTPRRLAARRCVAGLVVLWARSPAVGACQRSTTSVAAVLLPGSSLWLWAPHYLHRPVVFLLPASVLASWSCFSFACCHKLCAR